MRFAIDLPEPCLVVLVGAAGAGKSTFAARHFASDEILASDAFRARLGRGEADQGVNGRVFGALHAAVGRRLAAGRTTVVDATNVRLEARRALVARAATAGRPAVAIVLDLSLDECVAGDRERDGRHVPPAIIEAQWRRLRSALRAMPADPATSARRIPVGSAIRPGGSPLAGEGFAAVHLLSSRAAADAVVVRRVAGRSPTLVGTPRPGRSTRAGRPGRHSRAAEDVERA